MSSTSRPIVYYNFLRNKFEGEIDNQEQESKDIKKVDGQKRPVVMPFHDDGPWEIRKVLKKSDVGNLTRLLLSSDIVKNFILSYWDSKIVNWVEKVGKSCLKVKVLDMDTLTKHVLIFKKWKSNQSYVFQGDWSSQFVKRRSLKVGDEIGMFWNPFNGFFVFKLLKRANPDGKSIK